MKKLIILTIGLVVAGLLIYPHWARRDFRYAIGRLPQDALRYVDQATAKKPLLTTKQQQSALKTFFKHYFAPWHGSFLFEDTVMAKAILEQRNKNYLANPRWGGNYLQYDQTWMQKIIKNENLSQYPNANYPAITLRRSSVRGLPTDQPAFDNPKKAGEGYPFDYLQLAHIHAQTPVLVVHVSCDGAWKFIITPS